MLASLKHVNTAECKDRCKRQSRLPPSVPLLPAENGTNLSYRKIKGEEIRSICCQLCTYIDKRFYTSWLTCHSLPFSAANWIMTVAALLLAWNVRVPEERRAFFIPPFFCFSSLTKRVTPVGGISFTKWKPCVFTSPPVSVSESGGNMKGTHFTGSKICLGMWLHTYKTVHHKGMSSSQ